MMLVFLIFPLFSFSFLPMKWRFQVMYDLIPFPTLCEAHTDILRLIVDFRHQNNLTIRLPSQTIIRLFMCPNGNDYTFDYTVRLCA